MDAVQRRAFRTGQRRPPGRLRNQRALIPVQPGRDRRVTDQQPGDHLGRRPGQPHRTAQRGGQVEPREGGWTPKRIVVLEFPSMAQARTWYDSPEYAPLIKLRQKASKGKLILVEGA